MEQREGASRVVIRKYPNRRLYDTRNSRYVNLRQIAELIRNGETVEVVDATTGEDISKIILTQIILDEEKGQRSVLPSEFLHEIIKSGEAAYGQFAEKFLEAGVEAYRTAQAQMESTFSGLLKPWLALSNPPEDSEIRRLKARVAELESLLAERDKR